MRFKVGDKVVVTERTLEYIKNGEYIPECSKYVGQRGIVSVVHKNSNAYTIDFEIGSQYFLEQTLEFEVAQKIQDFLDIL